MRNHQQSGYLPPDLAEVVYADRVAKRQERVNLKAILADPEKRRELFIKTIIATQAREGITTTYEQAATAYDKVQGELPEIKARVEALLNDLEDGQ